MCESPTVPLHFSVFTLGSYVLPPEKANQPIGAAGSRVGPGWTAPMNRCDQGADDPSGSGEAG